MQVAIDFSRSAYGYAFLVGGMSSVLAYLHMQTVQRGYFDVITGASVEANNQAVASITGIPTSDILMAYWQNSTYRCAHHCQQQPCALAQPPRPHLQPGDLTRHRVHAADRGMRAGRATSWRCATRSGAWCWPSVGHSRSATC